MPRTHSACLLYRWIAAAIAALPKPSALWPEAVMYSFAKRVSLIWWRVGMRRSHPDGRLGSPPCVAE